MNDSKAQAFGIRILLALGMLFVMAVANVDTPATVSAHGGDANLVHACVNDTNAETLIVHPGPGNPNIDCVNPPWPLGAGWSPVDLTTWSGAGTGSMSPANLNDNVGIGTATPNEQLEITGNFRLPTSTATEGIIMSDGNPFIHSFGTDNFFAGANAGNLTMTGGNNTGVGVEALLSNTTGTSNTATGWRALQANTTGFNNTAVGHFALFDNTTGSSNTSIGLNALKVNTTGSRNTASGDSALRFNMEGSANTATGREALSFNSTGINNTGIGYLALLTNTTGSNNTGIGYFADLAGSSLTNATAIGANAKVDASNKIRLGDGAVTVVETSGDVYVDTQGFGLILRDTDGIGCHRITVNSASSINSTVVTCP